MFLYGEGKRMKLLNEELIKEIHVFIVEHQIKNGKSPSFRDIMNELGIKSISTVQRYVKLLKDRNIIDSDTRGSIALDWRLKSSNTVCIPLVGEVPCGAPITAIENIEANYQLPVELFGNGEMFMLKAKGMSMIGAGINHGDIMVIKKQESADNGEVVIALLDNEDVTCKTFWKRDGKIVLHPENPNFDDIETESCQIIGTVHSVIHKM